ncbi:hypothetical protein DFH29DRAFT_880848 [Suillus ampliporus]|nr:hypothetical protein DFH29DRAFT_880848 [Suillus ampliporus]
MRDATVEQVVLLVKCDRSQNETLDLDLMGSDVFSASGSMGKMPKKISTQAEFFWAKSNAAAATATATAAVTDAGVGGGWKMIKALLRRATQRTIDAIRDTLARLAVKFRRV